MKKILFIILVFLLFTTNIQALDIKSKNYVLYNLDNNQIVLEKNKDETIKIASLTKLMTILVAIENINHYNDLIIITPDVLEGLKELDAAVVGFQIGQLVTYDDLLYGAMLPSGADATRALAINISGSEVKFADLMNKKAEDLGMFQTHFVNSSGLDDINQHSSVEDVAKLLKYALENEKFKEIYTTNKYFLSDGKMIKNTLSDISKILNDDLKYIKGSKTGYTTQALRCLSSLAYDDIHSINYLLVTAGAENNETKSSHYLDAVNIYQYVFKNYQNYNVLNKDDVLIKLDTQNTKEDQVIIKAQNDYTTYADLKYDPSKIIKEYEGLTVVSSNVKKGSQIGKLYIKYDGEVIKTIDIVLDEDLTFSLFKYITNNLFLSMLMGTIIFISFLLIIKITINKKINNNKLNRINQ